MGPPAATPDPCEVADIAIDTANKSLAPFVEAMLEFNATSSAKLLAALDLIVDGFVAINGTIVPAGPDVETSLVTPVTEAISTLLKFQDTASSSVSAAVEAIENGVMAA